VAQVGDELDMGHGVVSVEASLCVLQARTTELPRWAAMGEKEFWGCRDPVTRCIVLGRRPCHRAMA